MDNVSADITPPAAEAPPQPPRAGCLAYLLFGLAAAWIVAGSGALHAGAWFVDQFVLISSSAPIPGWGWLLIAWGHGLLVLLTVAPLAFFTRPARLRAAYQTWLLAAAAVFGFGLIRLFPATWTQPAAFAQALLSALLTACLLAFVWYRRRAGGRTGKRLGFSWRFGALLPALGWAPIVILPSLLWGALGSPLDTVLNLAAGLSLGLLAGVLLDVFLFRPLRAESSGPGRDIAFGGFAAGVALLILGTGFGFGGSQLLLLIGLPALGFAVMALSRYADPPAPGPDDASAAWLPTAALVGLAAAAPLMFVDPDEVTLLLGGNEIMGWALGAAGVSLGLAWLVGAVLWALRNRVRGPLRLRASINLLAVTWAGAGLVYIFAGQPGFYGERLFVILKDQADLSAAYDIADRDERLRYVFETLTRHGDNTQARLRSALDRVGADYQPYYLVNALEVNGGPLLRLYLSLQPEVDRVLDSPRLRPLPAPAPTSSGSQPAPAAPPWNITLIGADRVWDELGITGAGIVVGQSDSGVQGDHPAVSDGYRGRGGQHDYNWFDPWNRTRAPVDIGGHGTHTLGSAVGGVSSGGGAPIGVAPGAEWFACVNLARNLANAPLYLDCMQFMLAPFPLDGDPWRDGDPTLAAHVLNNSWGCPPLEGCDARVLEPAVRALRAAGLFVVASAGNTGPQCGSVGDPLALYDDVFTVGSVDQFGNVAEFSSRGPVRADGSQRVKPDILAPGGGGGDLADQVLSAYPGSGYEFSQGTSMAGPHVVGVVALMWSAQPKLIGDVDRTEQILIETARPYEGSRADGCFEGGVPNAGFGYGVVDAYAAVQAALAEK